MAEVLFSLHVLLTAAFSFNLGLLVSTGWVLRKLKRFSDSFVEQAEKIVANDEVTRDDVRAELMRDRVAAEIVCGDDTPEEVVRYLYIEAERRARLRKRGGLQEHDNDLFAIPPFNPDIT